MSQMLSRLFHQIIKAKRKVHEMTKCFIRFSTIKKDGSLPNNYKRECKMEKIWRERERKLHEIESWESHGEKCKYF